MEKNLAVKIEDQEGGAYEIEPYQQVPKGARKLVSEKLRDISSRLSPLLANVPGLATAKELQTGKYYLGVHRGALTSAKDGGMLGSVRNLDTGKMSEQARFYQPENLQSLVNFNMAFSLVSTLVAQKHLADISAKLDGLKKGVDSIHQFQKDKRRAGIDSAAKELPLIIQTECTDMGITTANGVAVKLKETQEHLSKEIEESLATFEAGGDSLKDEASREALAVVLYENRACIELGAIAAFILGQRESERGYAQARIHELEELARQHESYLERADKVLSDHKPLLKKSIMGHIKRAFTKSGINFSEEVQLISKSKTLRKDTLLNSKVDASLTKSLTDQLNQAVVLEIENGEVTALYQP